MRVMQAVRPTVTPLVSRLRCKVQTPGRGRVDENPHVVESNDIRI